MSGSIGAVTTWWRYVQTIARTAQQSEIAEAAQVSQATVSRWQSGEIAAPAAQSAVAFARHYDAPVGAALVAAGVLSESELPVTSMRYENPDDATLIRLLTERLERCRREEPGDGTPMNGPEDDLTEVTGEVVVDDPTEGSDPPPSRGRRHRRPS